MMFLSFSSPKVSLFYSGVLGLIYLFLAAYVIRQRWKKLTGLGHGTDPKCPLFRAVRIHANFSEFVPLILLFLTLDEMTGRDAWVTHALGASLVVGRISHFIGIRGSDKVSIGRSLGVLLTYLPLLLLSLFLIIKGVA